jgi:hypothetical protein
MRRQRKRLEVIEAPDQGHAPIPEPAIVGRIAAFRYLVRTKCAGTALKSSRQEYEVLTSNR